MSLISTFAFAAAVASANPAPAKVETQTQRTVQVIAKARIITATRIQLGGTDARPSQTRGKKGLIEFE